MTEDTDTIELTDSAEIRDGKAIVTYTRTEAALVELRAKYAGATYDLTTTAGDKAARAARLELVSLRTSLEKKRKEFKAPALDFGKKVDGEAARIAAEILALEAPIDAQIKADEKRREDERIAKEQAEAARRKVHTDGIAKIAGYVALATDLPAERIAAGIAYLEALDLAGFEEFITEATETRARTVSALQALHAKAVNREAEAARLEAERVEQARIAEEQAETARKLKEQQDELARQLAEVQQREERIRKEEEARAAEKVRMEQEAAAREQRAREEAEAAQRRADLAAQRHFQDAAGTIPATKAGDPVGRVATTTDYDPTGFPAQIAHPTATGHAVPLPNIVPMPTKAPADDGARINLSDIKDRIAPLSITAEGLAQLGFPHVAQEKASKLYRAADFPRMRGAMVKHLMSLDRQEAA